MAQTTTELILKTIVQGTEAAVSKVKGLTSSINSASEKAKESSQFLAKWGAIAAGAVTAGAVLATKSFISFEDQLANVRKTTGASTDEIKKIGDELLTYSQTTRSSIDELLTIGTIGGSLGIATKDIESFTKAVDKINIALSDEFGGSVEAVTKSVSGLRLIFKDMQSDNIADDLLRIGNALNVAGNVGAATADVVSDFAGRIGGVAAPLGFTTGQVLGLSAAMQELQIEPERGSGAFTQIVQKMGQDINGFASIAGLSVAQFKKLYNEDINGAFLAVAQGISQAGTSNTKYIETLNKVGLDGIRTSEVIGKLGNNIKLVRERQGQLAAATKETSSVLSEYDVKNNTAAASVAKLRNSVNTLAVNFVGLFADGLKSAVDGITKLVQKVPELVAEFKKWYDNSVLVRSGVVLISGAIIGAFVPALIALATAAGTALVALAPFMITGALIAGLVAGIIWLYNNWDKAINAIGDLIIWLHDTSQKFFGAIADWIKTKMDAIKNYISTKLEAIRTFFRNVWEDIKAIPGNALEATKRFVKEKLDAIAKFFGDSMTNIRKALDDKVGAIKDFFINLPDRISGWIAQTPGVLYNSGKKMIQEFVDGITVWNPELNKAAGQAAQTLADNLELHSPAKKGPLSRLDKWLVPFGKTIAPGLLNGLAPVLGIITTVANSISTTITDRTFAGPKKAFASFSSAVKQEADNTKSETVTLFSTLEAEMLSFQSVVNSFPENIRGNLQQANDSFKSFSTSVVESSVSMKEEFNDNMNDLSVKIANTNEDILELNKTFTAKTAEQTKKLADQFVEQKNKIVSIKQEIADKLIEIDESIAESARRSATEQFNAQVKAFNDSKSSIDAEIEAMEERMKISKADDQILSEQKAANDKRADLQRQLNGILLEMSKLKVQSASEKDLDQVDIIKRKMNELAYNKTKVEQEMANIEVDLAKKAQDRLTNTELEALKNRKKEIDSQLTSLQTSFDEKNSALKAIEDQKAVESTKTRLNEELLAMQNKLNLEQSSLRKARDLEYTISSEIRDAKRRNRQSEFTNFVDTWNAEKIVMDEEQVTKLSKLQRELEETSNNAAAISTIYTANQQYIKDLYTQTKDTYLSTLNEQTVGTQYYTSLMSSYFENVGNSIATLTEQPFLEGTKKFSSINPQEFGFDPSGNIVPKSQISVVQQTATPRIAAETPIIASRAVNPQKPTQTINVVIDTFLGQDSFARKALDGFVGTLKRAISP